MNGPQGEDFLSSPAVLSLDKTDSREAEVKVQRRGTEHVVLAVTDDGKPSLTSYRRVIITAK